MESIILPPADMTGQIRLGITETFSAYLLPTLLPALRKQFPNIIFNIHECDRADIEQALLANTLDLGIIIVSNLQEKTHLHYEVMLRSERNLWLDPEKSIAILNNDHLSRCRSTAVYFIRYGRTSY